MSPKTTPNAPTVSANCAGDRLFATSPTTVIPTNPPIPADLDKLSPANRRPASRAALGPFGCRPVGETHVLRQIASEGCPLLVLHARAGEGRDYRFESAVMSVHGLRIFTVS